MAPIPAARQAGGSEVVAAVNADYFIERETLDFLEDLTRQSREEHPECVIGFGWGGDSSGWTGVNCGLYHERVEAMPAVYSYEGTSIYLAFHDVIPEEQKSGVICFRGNHFEILPVEDFARDQLVVGILEPDPERPAPDRGGHGS